MDKFKLRPGIGKIYDIDEETYSRLTQKDDPYCKKSKNKKSYYAVCPECDNPIQIVGMFKQTIEAGKKPYGRHNKGSIPGLADYCEEDYLNCSYSNPAWKKPHTKRHANSKVAQESMTTMRTYFDLVVETLSKDIDIYISYNLAREMLSEYLFDEGWLYYDATLNNLPWILGMANNWHTMYGRYIVRDSELYKAIEKNCPNVKFKDQGKYVQISNKNGEFINLGFFFYHHVKKVVGEHLTETIDFRVAEGNAPTATAIYDKTINIDTDSFMNLISRSSSIKRNEKYLEIANKLIKI